MRRTMMTVIPLLLLSAAPVHAQGQNGWRISEVSGDVRISEGGRSRAATRGALLASGSTITAGARARAVLVRGQQYVTVSPNTQLRVAVPQPQQSRGVIQMITDWGSALFRVDRREAPHFGVQTPYLAAVVRGTTFTVTVGQSGASVQVTEGVVEVSTLDGGASDLVRPGMIASVGASDLFQLTINGDQERVIRSRNAPAAGAVTVPAPAAQPSSSAQTSITQAIGEPSVDLADATRGLIRGEPSLELAVLRPSVTGNAAPPLQAAQPATPPPPPVLDPPPPPVSDPPPPPASDPGPPPVSEPPPPPPTGPGDDVGDPGSGDDQGDHNGDGHPDNGDNGDGPGQGDDQGDHNGDGHPDNGDNGHGPDGDHNGDGHPDNGDNGHDPDGDHNGDGHPDNGDNGSRPDRDRGPPRDPRGRPD